MIPYLMDNGALVATWIVQAAAACGAAYGFIVVTLRFIEKKGR